MNSVKWVPHATFADEMDLTSENANKLRVLGPRSERLGVFLRHEVKIGMVMVLRTWTAWPVGLASLQDHLRL